MKTYLSRPESEYLSKNHTDCLKGIMASLVLMCHLRGRMPVLNDTVIGSLFTALGYLSVSVFFFISGYGLMASYKNKGDGYIRDFPKNRILPFYCICLCWTGIYVLFNLLMGKDMAWTEILLSLFFGGTVILNGWYLQTILVFYLLFYVSFRFAGKYKECAVAAGTVLYIAGCVALGLSTTWYEAVWCFLLGILWNKYRERIDSVLSEKQYYIKIFLSAAVCFGAFLIAGNTNITGGGNKNILQNDFIRQLCYFNCLCDRDGSGLL